MAAVAPYDPANRDALAGVPADVLAKQLKQKEERMGPSERKFRDSAKWGAVGIIAFAIVVVAFKWGPPSVSVDAPDRWTRTDQVEYSHAQERADDKRDAQITALTKIVEKQDRMLERLTEQGTTLLALVAKQEDRIKALEEWQRSPRTPQGDHR